MALGPRVALVPVFPLHPLMCPLVLEWPLSLFSLFFSDVALGPRVALVLVFPLRPLMRALVLEWPLSLFSLFVL